MKSYENDREKIALNNQLNPKEMAQKLTKSKMAALLLSQITKTIHLVKSIMKYSHFICYSLREGIVKVVFPSQLIKCAEYVRPLRKMDEDLSYWR